MSYDIRWPNASHRWHSFTFSALPFEIESIKAAKEGGGAGGRFCSLMCVGSIALALDIDGIVTALVACPNCNTSPRAAKVFVKQNN